MTEFHDILSRSVYLARLKAGLTSAQLARLIGCDRTTISRIESGRLGAKLETAVKIANACEIPFTELFHEFDKIKI